MRDERKEMKMAADREAYDRDLKRRQDEHLKGVFQNVYDIANRDWQPCLHDACRECHGTGMRVDGSSCIHGISCPCPKCNSR